MDRGRTAGGGAHAWPPNRWKLWALPLRALTYVLSAEIAAVTLVVVMATSTPAVPGNGWLTAALLVICAVAQLHVSHVMERGGQSRPQRVDLSSVWIFAGVLVLPPLPVVLLVALIHGHRWLLVGRFDAARPPHRNVFTAAALTLTALATVTVAERTGLAAHLAVGSPGIGDFVALLATLATYWLVHTALAAGVPVLTSRAGDALGTRTDNVLESGQLVLGAFVAMALSWWPPAALLMIVPMHLVHQTVLLHQLKLAARTDHRTGLLHAVAWQDQAEHELERARREGGRLALLLMDLDLFKRINDQYGHQTGDEVLARFAALLSQDVRRVDHVGRYGGEEFAVLQRDAGEEDAMALAERIRTRVRDLDVTGPEGQPVRISVTIGVAVWPDVGESSVHGLIRAADAALYRGKHEGRDRVRVAHPATDVVVPASRRARFAG